MERSASIGLIPVAGGIEEMVVFIIFCQSRRGDFIEL